MSPSAHFIRAIIASLGSSQSIRQCSDSPVTSSRAPSPQGQWPRLLGKHPTHTSINSSHMYNNPLLFLIVAPFSVSIRSLLKPLIPSRTSTLSKERNTLKMENKYKEQIYHTKYISLYFLCDY